MNVKSRKKKSYLNNEACNVNIQALDTDTDSAR